MTKYQKIAANAVSAYLYGRREPVLLFDLSCTADSAAYKAGKVKELFPSLFDYVDLLPPDWRCAWLTTGGDRMYYAVPMSWLSGESDSQSLLLGFGKLTESYSPYD